MYLEDESHRYHISSLMDRKMKGEKLDGNLEKGFGMLRKDGCRCLTGIKFAFIPNIINKKFCPFQVIRNTLSRLIYFYRISFTWSNTSLGNLYILESERGFLTFSIISQSPFPDRRRFL